LGKLFVGFRWSVSKFRLFSKNKLVEMGDGMLVVMFGEGVDAAMLFSMSAEMNGTLDSLTEEIQISLV